jgi:hypothetical protein
LAHGLNLGFESPPSQAAARLEHTAFAPTPPLFPVLSRPRAGAIIKITINGKGVLGDSWLSFAIQAPRCSILQIRFVSFVDSVGRRSEGAGLKCF